jgi:phytoene dehydrogenase-like protein
MNEFHDIAIVGAGVSGLYSAWRVLEDAAANAHALKVTVFESGDRVGGRLLSVKPPFVNDTLVELGGMRFSESQRLTRDLIAALGLESRELADANPDNIAYLRGQRIRKGELINPERLPYVIDESLRNPESLQNLLAVAAVRALGPAFQQVLDFDLTLETLKDVSVAQWRAVGERGLFEGKPLYETPLHYLLERTLGHGAVQLLQDSLGYDCILWTWSAADGFPWNLADFCGGVLHRHLTEGFAALPMRLADRVVARGGEVRLHTTLKAIDGHVLPDGTAGVCFTTCDRAGVESTHLARKLILAMPRRAIELLDKKGALFDEPAAGFKALLVGARGRARVARQIGDRPADASGVLLESEPARQSGRGPDLRRRVGEVLLGAARPRRGAPQAGANGGAPPGCALVGRLRGALEGHLRGAPSAARAPWPGA